MEIIKIYHWAMPVNLHEQFKNDWGRITKNVAVPMGQKMATLFQMKNGDFISVTRWPDETSYNKWVNWIMSSTEGILYHPYEQERGEPIIVLI